MHLRTPLAAVLLAGVALCQVPIPPHAAIYQGFSRGFNFTAQTPFLIVGLDLPTDAFVVGDTASYLLRVNGATALWSIGNVGPIAAAIPINIGDVVDVIGNWSPAVTSNFSAHNSYGNTAPYATTIHGIAHTLNRTGWQWDVGAPGWVSTGATGTYLAPTSGQLGRVLLHTSQSGLFANFSANVTGGPSPLAVNFTSTSVSSDPGGITSYAWDLDGDSVIDSTVQNPSFVYATCGSFDVTLTITDAVHPPSTLTRTAYIKTDQITADFTYQLIGPLTVLFTDTSNMPATSWDWDLNGDGITDSTLQNPAFVYPSATANNVTLKVTRLCSPISQVTKSVFPAQQLSTNLAANNGGASLWTVYFNINVLNPLGVNISAFDVISSTVSTPFTVDTYLKLGSHSGSEYMPGAWTQVATASGTSNPVANQPSNATFPLPLHIPFGSYGMALRYTGIVPRYTTQAAIITVGNGDLSLTMGSAAATTVGPFQGTTTTVNTPRAWSGTIYYGTNNVTQQAGYGWFGPGCPGSIGQSHLVNTTTPQLGGTLSVNVSNMQFGIGLMILGLSNTISGFGPLPVDLSAIGMTGCPLRVSLDATQAVVGAGTSATWTFAIPNSPPLIGFLLYNQCANFDTINPFGLVLSDACASVLGN